MKPIRIAAFSLVTPVVLIVACSTPQSNQTSLQTPTAQATEVQTARAIIFTSPSTLEIKPGPSTILPLENLIWVGNPNKLVIAASAVVNHKPSIVITDLISGGVTLLIESDAKIVAWLP